MREIFLRFLLVLISILTVSCSRTPETSDEVDKRVFKLPIEQVKELAAGGDSSAKFRLLMENKDTLSEAEKLKRLSELYEKDKHLAAGYQLATLTPDPAKREQILKEISESGSSPTALLAKSSILASKLNSDFGKDAKQAYDELLNLAKGGVQPAAAELAFFIKTNFSQLKNPSDFYEGALIAYKTLAEKSSFDAKYYRLCQAEFLIRLGKWKDAAELLQPLAKDFMARSNFTMWDSLLKNLDGDFYAEAKACALLAYAYEDGLGVPKSAKKAGELRAKVYALQNEKFCKNFSYSFEESYGERAYFLCDSPREAKIYKDWARELEASRTERLRNYNLKVSREIEEVSKKPLEELKNASDEIGKVEYAKKLLGLETFDNVCFRIGKYNKEKAAEALSILKELAKHGSQYANLTLAELYQGGNSWNPSFAILNMPVDFDAQKAGSYARSALLLGGGEYKTYLAARAQKLLGDLSLYRTNCVLYISRSFFVGGSNLDGYIVKNSREDFEKALLHYRLAAALGSGEALWQLSIIYTHGVPIGMGKYLAEKNELAAFTYLKDAANLGNLDGVENMIMSLSLDDANSGNTAKILPEFIKPLLDSKLPPSTAHEIAAIYVEKGLIEGYKPEDAKRIRDSIPRNLAFGIKACYKSEKFESKAGKEYWENVTPKIEITENKFANYFKSLKQTQENRLLYAISALTSAWEDKCYDENIICEGILQWQELIKEAYPNAVKAATLAISIFGGDSNLLYRSEYSNSAMKLKLPLALYYFLIDEKATEYNMKGYEESKDEGFLIPLTRRRLDSKTLEFLSKYGKSDTGSIELAVRRLLRADANKNPKEFEETVSFIKEIEKGGKYKNDARVLLAYAYSGFPKMKNDPALFGEYLKGLEGGSLTFLLDTSLAYEDGIDEGDVNKMWAFARGIENSPKDSYYLLSEMDADKAYDLRAMHEKTPENKNLAYLLAEAEFYNKNYAEAEKLYAKLHKADAKNLRCAVRLAEIYYYGLGVKADRELALKYYNMLFDELKGDCEINYGGGEYAWSMSVGNIPILLSYNSDFNSDALNIFINSIYNSDFDPDYPAIKIPLELIEKNIEEIPLKNLSVASKFILDFLSRNKLEKLREKLEKKLLEAKDRNIMKLAAAKNLELKTPAGDAKAFEIFNELLRSGDKSVLNTVGALYFLGKGVGKDYGKAREIFESGSTLEPEISQEACLWLALMHMEGLGVEKSEETSLKYLRLTYKLGSSHEVFNMAKFLIHAQNFPIGSLGLIPHSRKLGAELMKYLIEENASIASYRDNSALEYARFLEDGKYIEKNLSKAAEIYETCARVNSLRGDGQGYIYLGDAIRALKSSGSERDLKKAFALAGEWLELEPDSINAKLEMGLLKMFGIACEKDPKAAFKYITEATNSSPDKDANLWRAYGLLAYCYLEGIGVQKSEDKAREVAEKVGKIKGRIHYLSGVGLGDTMLDLASWFVASKEPWEVAENPLLPQSKNCALFWLNEYERKADKAEDANYSKEVYQKLIDFYEKHKELAGNDKIARLNEKISKLNNKTK